MKFLYAPNNQVSKVESDLKVNFLCAVARGLGVNANVTQIYAKRGIDLRAMMNP